MGCTLLYVQWTCVEAFDPERVLSAVSSCTPLFVINGFNYIWKFPNDLQPYVWNWNIIERILEIVYWPVYRFGVPNRSIFHRTVYGTESTWQWNDLLTTTRNPKVESVFFGVLFGESIRPDNGWPLSKRPRSKHTRSNRMPWTVHVAFGVLDFIGVRQG